jgi:hypothetical protein
VTTSTGLGTGVPVGVIDGAANDEGVASRDGAAIDDVGPTDGAGIGEQPARMADPSTRLIRMRGSIGDDPGSIAASRSRGCD